MALHDFTMQQWWMESLTAKIIAIFIRITRILLLLLLFFLSFERLSGERRPTASHADGPSLKVAASSGNCIQKVQVNTKRVLAELDQGEHIFKPFALSGLA